MGKRIDMTGKVIGRLTVICRAENTKDGQAQWLCVCECGNTCIVLGSNLRNNRTTSCGCFRKELTAERFTTHGMCNTTDYFTYNDMIQRTTNPNHPDYPNYGGRGITVCDEWLFSFPAFQSYISKLEHYGEDGYSLDRIDNNLGYQPGNVRYVDKKTQNRNTRRNVFVELNGRRVTIAEASEITGIPYKVLWDRIKRGDTGERLYRPVRKKKK